MRTTVDPRQTWWIWRDVQNRLTKWTHALLQGRSYRILLNTTGATYNDPINHIIQVNPQMFAKLEPDRQFRLTQGLLAHEVGHALFTDAWPESEENILCEMTNILEDERIERAVSTYFPGIVPVIHILGDRLLSDVRHKQCGEYPDEMQAYVCCLVWRWAHSRIPEWKMLERLHTSPEARFLWQHVKPLVEEAWCVQDTRRVIEMAQKILEILEVDFHRPPSRVIVGAPFDIPRERAETVQSIPDRPSDTQPGIGFVKGKHISGEKDLFTESKPYLDLESRATPNARQLAEAMKLATRDVRLLPHAYAGRFNLRQDLRTPETPNLARTGVEHVIRDLVLYLLVDRSGSMCDMNADVQLALMTVYLAAVEVNLPIGIAYFGSADHPGSHDRVFEIASISEKGSEEVKSLIAGYEGVTGAEFLHWALRLGEEKLSARPEKKKVLIVIHDGKPVYKEEDGDDWELSLTRLHHIENRSITPIGVYLGTNAEDLNQLKMLFPRFIQTSGSALPEKLGALLRGLAR